MLSEFESLKYASDLPGGNQKRGHHQNDECSLVVEPEGVVVDAHRVEFDQPLHGAEHVKHLDGWTSPYPPQMDLFFSCRFDEECCTLFVH